MADNDKDSGGGFEDYEETTVDPGIWLLLATTFLCFFVMLVVMPIMVARKMRQRKKEEDIKEATDYTHIVSSSWEAKPQEGVAISAASIARPDAETRRILGLAVPFTSSGLVCSLCSNICLILVSRFVGTKALTAYAVVEILVGLEDGVLKGPISACTTLCSQAVGAGNPKLAGVYIQLSIIFYLILKVPIIFFWYFFMYEVVNFLEWGDQEIALQSQEFVRVYIWSYVFGSASSALWQLLEITDHAFTGTLFSMAWGATNVFLVGFCVLVVDNVTLTHVGMIYNVSALLFTGITFFVANSRGWLNSFKEGLFHTFALKEHHSMQLLLKQAVPLSFGSLLSNAEWAVMTFFASHLGPAEVATWAILGSIWGIFYATTAGIGDAAEIRVAHYLGENQPAMAQLSAYKSLFLGMVVASIVSVVYFSLQNVIPGWFTVDPTLQAMLLELVPFVGVGNLAMTFGMQCWSLIGAQGKYKLATWVHFLSSWGVCMPLAAIFVYGFRIDLQGLTSALVIGYITTGATLSYVLLCTDWKMVAQKIQQRSTETASGETPPAGERDDDSTAEEELYASLGSKTHHPSKAAATHNIRLLTLLRGLPSGVIFVDVDGRPGIFVSKVQHWSHFHNHIHQGDCLKMVNGKDVSFMTGNTVTKMLEDPQDFDRDLTFVVDSARLDDDGDSALNAVSEDTSSGSKNESLLASGAMNRSLLSRLSIMNKKGTESNV